MTNHVQGLEHGELGGEDVKGGLGEEVLRVVIYLFILFSLLLFLMFLILFILFIFEIFELLLLIVMMVLVMLELLQVEEGFLGGWVRGRGVIVVVVVVVIVVVGMVHDKLAFAVCFGGCKQLLLIFADF